MSSASKEDNTNTTETAPAELTAVVDDLINQLTTKFSAISADMIAKMDEMSRRLDNLEATIQENARQSESDDNNSSQ